MDWESAIFAQIEFFSHKWKSYQLMIISLIEISFGLITFNHCNTKFLNFLFVNHQ